MSEFNTPKLVEIIGEQWLCFPKHMLPSGFGKGGIFTDKRGQNFCFYLTNGSVIMDLDDSSYQDFKANKEVRLVPELIGCINTKFVVKLNQFVRSGRSIKDIPKYLNYFRKEKNNGN